MGTRRVNRQVASEFFFLWVGTIRARPCIIFYSHHKWSLQREENRNTTTNNSQG